MKPKSHIPQFLKDLKHKECDKKWRDNKKKFNEELSETLIELNIVKIEGRTTQIKLLDATVLTMNFLCTKIDDLLELKRQLINHNDIKDKLGNMDININCIYWVQVVQAYENYVYPLLNEFKRELEAYDPYRAIRILSYDPEYIKNMLKNNYILLKATNYSSEINISDINGSENSSYTNTYSSDKMTTPSTSNALKKIGNNSPCLVVGKSTRKKSSKKLNQQFLSEIWNDNQNGGFKREGDDECVGDIRNQRKRRSCDKRLFKNYMSTNDIIELQQALPNIDVIMTCMRPWNGGNDLIDLSHLNMIREADLSVQFLHDNWLTDQQTNINTSSTFNCNINYNENDESYNSASPTKYQLPINPTINQHDLYNKGNKFNPHLNNFNFQEVIDISNSNISNYEESIILLPLIKTENWFDNTPTTIITTKDISVLSTSQHNDFNKSYFTNQITNLDIPIVCGSNNIDNGGNIILVDAALYDPGSCFTTVLDNENIEMENLISEQIKGMNLISNIQNPPLPKNMNEKTYNLQCLKQCTIYDTTMDSGLVATQEERIDHVLDKNYFNDMSLKMDSSYVNFLQIPDKPDKFRGSGELPDKSGQRNENTEMSCRRKLNFDLTFEEATFRRFQLHNSPELSPTLSESPIQNIEWIREFNDLAFPLCSTNEGAADLENSYLNYIQFKHMVESPITASPLLIPKLEYTSPSQFLNLPVKQEEDMNKEATMPIKVENVNRSNDDNESSNKNDN